VRSGDGVTLSVLLPTRNGGKLIGECVDAVLRQEDANFELVVSDNANADGTTHALAARADDPRLRVLRQDQLLSVTENWNATLAASRGDYVLMIGDDDLVLPGALAELQRALERLDRPDCLSFNAVRYVAPDAVRNVHSSWYVDPYFDYDERFDGRTELDAGLRREILEDLFRFEIPFPLTMQLTAVSRSAVNGLRRGLFQSPFPDHYAIGALLLNAQRWALWDGKPVVIGVSAKSFGHYFFGEDDNGGLGYLGVVPDFPGRLPGNEVTNASAAWLLELARDYPDLLGDLRVNRAAYVVRHLWAWLRQARSGSLSVCELIHRLDLLSPRDALSVSSYLLRPDVLAHASRAARASLGGGRTDALWTNLSELPEVPDISAFGEWWSAGLESGAAR
jgi:glycosyltransferase involved in cell wall biosynthesis